MSVRRFTSETRDKRPLEVQAGYEPLLSQHWLVVVAADTREVVFSNLCVQHWPRRAMTERDVLRVLKEHLRVGVPPTLGDDLRRDKATKDGVSDVTYEAIKLKKGNL